jgi:hypothetical protein
MIYVSKKIRLTLLAILIMVTMVVGGSTWIASVHAQTTAESEKLLNAAGGSQGANLSATDPRQIVVNIIRILLSLAGIVLFCFMFYAGYLWLTAAGNEEQVEHAKGIIKTTIIGLLIILLSLSITQFIIFYAQIGTGNGYLPSGYRAGGGVQPGAGYNVYYGAGVR